MKVTIFAAASIIGLTLAAPASEKRDTIAQCATNLAHCDASLAPGDTAGYTACHNTYVACFNSNSGWWKRSEKREEKRDTIAQCATNLGHCDASVAPGDVAGYTACHNTYVACFDSNSGWWKRSEKREEKRDTIAQCATNLGHCDASVAPGDVAGYTACHNPYVACFDSNSGWWKRSEKRDTIAQCATNLGHCDASVAPGDVAGYTACHNTYVACFDSSTGWW